jgi:hypothetical protein
VENPTIGQQPGLVQPVAGTPKQRQGSATVGERLFEPTDSDVDQGALGVDLPEKFSGRPFGRSVKLIQCRVGVASLQQSKGQAQARLDFAGMQLACLGDVYGSPQASLRGGEPTGLTRRQPDCTVGD